MEYTKISDLARLRLKVCTFLDCSWYYESHFDCLLSNLLLSTMSKIISHDATLSYPPENHMVETGIINQYQFSVLQIIALS